MRRFELETMKGNSEQTTIMYQSQFELLTLIHLFAIKTVKRQIRQNNVKQTCKSAIYLRIARMYIKNTKHWNFIVIYKHLAEPNLN